MTKDESQPTDRHKHPPLRSFLASLRHAGRAAVVSVAVALALLSYPSSLHWMIAGWLAWHTVSVARGRPGWIPLVACLVVLLVKRVYWPMSLFWLVSSLIVVALVRGMCEVTGKRPGHYAWIGTAAVVWIGWGFFWYEWQAIARCDHPARIWSARPVVCIGDSLTSGLLPDNGYPDQLAKMLRVPVVNLGQAGITTRNGLNLLPRITEVNPQVVIIELGGHDFLKGKSRSATKANLVQIIAACRENGSEVVLVEIPRGFIIDPFAGLEREIADEQDLELVADTAIRQLVLWSPIAPPGIWLPDSHLSNDGLHSNARGSKYLARRVANALMRMYGEDIIH